LAGLTVMAGGRLPRRMWHEAPPAVGAEVADLGGGFLALPPRRRHDARLEQLGGPRRPRHGAPGRGQGARPPTAHVRPACASRPTALPARDLGRRATSCRCGGPCVVKPGERGRRLGHHERRAHGAPAAPRPPARRPRCTASCSSSAMVPGDVLRFLFLDGAAPRRHRRRPPAVTATGARPILELIAAENERRFAAAAASGPGSCAPDLDAGLHARSGRLRLSSVPPPGARLRVKTAVARTARPTTRASRTRWARTRRRRGPGRGGRRRAAGGASTSSRRTRRCRSDAAGRGPRGQRRHRGCTTTRRVRDPAHGRARPPSGCSSAS
jgi:hypothetical protein